MATADSIEQVIYQYLDADSTFKAKFEGIYWQDAPKETKPPFINFWMVDDNGSETLLNAISQGEARIQFDLWDSNKIRGVKLRTALRNKIRDLNEVRSGFHVMTNGITEQTLQRQSTTEPFHFIVDGIIKWNKE